MKKLLALVLVLGMVSAASAAYQFTIEGSKIRVSDNEPRIGGITLGFGVIGDAVLGEITLITDIDRPPVPIVDLCCLGCRGGPIFYPINPIDPWNDFVAIIWWGCQIEPFPAGDWIVVELIHPQGLVAASQLDYDVQVDVIDFGGFSLENSIIMNSLYFKIVPEPASMLLLGLGGLFLRRK